MGYAQRFFRWMCAYGHKLMNFLGIETGLEYLHMIILPEFERPEDNLHLYLYVVGKRLNDEPVDIEWYMWGREFAVGRKLKRSERFKARRNRHNLDLLNRWSRLWES